MLSLNIAKKERELKTSITNDSPVAGNCTLLQPQQTSYDIAYQKSETVLKRIMAASVISASAIKTTYVYVQAAKAFQKLLF